MLSTEVIKFFTFMITGSNVLDLQHVYSNMFKYDIHIVCSLYNQLYGVAITYDEVSSICSALRKLLFLIIHLYKQLCAKLR